MYLKLFLCAFFIFIGFITIQTSVVQCSSRQDYDDMRTNAVVNLTGLGTLRGSVDETKWTKTPFYRFVGVKYAESPSGNRRFKAPVPVKPWQGTRSAEDFGPGCPTYIRLSRMSEEERKVGDIEDCLSMDIYTRQVDENAKLPVMVYVLGGGFHLGTSARISPKYLCERNIVLVIPQSRIDALGYLSTMTQEIPGNAGLMDIIAVLEFIQTHIHKFGGDPNRVTAVGQSSGAAIVSALGISPTISPNLFQRMIVQSGSIYSSWAYAFDPVENAKDIGERAGVASGSIEQLNRAFMTMDLLQLLNATEHHNKENDVNGRNKVGGRSLTIGGPSNLIPEAPTNIRQKALYRKDLAVMAGVTKDDGTYLTANIFDELNWMLGNKSFFQFIDAALQFAGVDDEAGGFMALAVNAYWTQDEILRGDFGELSAGITDLAGTIALKAPILRLVQANAIYNPRNTYLYSFDYCGEYTRFGYGADTSHYPFEGGVHHSNDNIYLYCSPPEVSNLNEADTEMAKIMVQLWTSFVESGVPKLNHTLTAPEWLPAINGTGPYLHIDRDPRMDEDFNKEFFIATHEARMKPEMRCRR